MPQYCLTESQRSKALSELINADNDLKDPGGFPPLTPEQVIARARAAVEAVRDVIEGLEKS